MMSTPGLLRDYNLFSPKDNSIEKIFFEAVGFRLMQHRTPTRAAALEDIGQEDKALPEVPQP